MRKTYKFRLLGNKANIERIGTWLYLCRCLYNAALTQRIAIYRQNKGYISCYDQMRQLSELKTAFPEYKGISSHTLQDVIDRLDKAYLNFFRRVGKVTGRVGYPRFRGEDRYDSFTLKCSGWKLDGNQLIINKIGKFKLRISRVVEGNIKTITIRKESGNWYACVNCDNVPEKNLPKLVNSVGLDVGIKSFIVDSEGAITDNPKYFRKSEMLLRIKQRILAHRKKGSSRRRDAKVLVNKVHTKINNQRNDFLHKLANQYIRYYGTLIFEDLHIKGMVKNHKLAKSISDAGWGKFYELCAYKAEEAGRQIVRIPRFEPTSKTCSECGAINQELKLSDRKWICKECGILHDRDYNAAKNIKRVGQTQQVLTCAVTQSVACESHNINKRECQEAG